jgi:hypothetical protein
MLFLYYTILLRKSQEANASLTEYLTNMLKGLDKSPFYEYNKRYIFYLLSILFIYFNHLF